MGICCTEPRGVLLYDLEHLDGYHIAVLINILRSLGLCALWLGGTEISRDIGLVSCLVCA
jgi:hypothetical protein